MAFEGPVPARELTVAPYGLLSVADVLTTSDSPEDERWIRGFDQMSDANPQLVRLITKTNETVTGGTVASTDADLPQFFPVDPFFIEARDERGTFGLVHEDREARLLRQIEAVSQKAVEQELWSGPTAQAETGNTNHYLSEAGTTKVTTAGVDPKAALYLLEQAISNSPTGSGGVIHLTRDVASDLSNSNALHVENGILVTTLGTPVIVGSGYAGTGPSGDAAEDASATNKWAYLTGPVNVILGQSSVVNTRAEGFNTSINDLALQALRPAAVYFDSSIFYAAQITLPAIP